MRRIRGLRWCIKKRIAPSSKDIVHLLAETLKLLPGHRTFLLSLISNIDICIIVSIFDIVKGGAAGSAEGRG